MPPPPTPFPSITPALRSSPACGFISAINGSRRAPFCPRFSSYHCFSLPCATYLQVIADILSHICNQRHGAATPAPDELPLPPSVEAALVGPSQLFLQGDTPRARVLNLFGQLVRPASLSYSAFQVGIDQSNFPPHCRVAYGVRPPSLSYSVFQVGLQQSKAPSLKVPGVLALFGFPGGTERVKPPL